MNKSYILFSSFKRDIFTLVFPDGMAEHRVPLFRNFVVNGLIQMQTYCESYQDANVSFYDKDQSFDDCGLSVIQACRGQIGAVYAFKPSCRCTRYFYDSASLEKLSCFYEACRCAQSGCSPRSQFSLSDYTRDPAYCGYNVYGNDGCRPPYLAMEPEEDCAFKLSEKNFAIGPQNKLWLWPRFPCGYLIGVHWRGIRRSYLDTDYVLDDEDLKDCVAAYVESENARRVDKDQATADKVYALYRLKAGDIIFREERDLKPRTTRLCIEGLDVSELVQIYPDNPYPTYVGYACGQKKTESVTEEEPEPEPEPEPVSFLSAEQSVTCDDEDATLTSTEELPAHLSIVDNALVLAAGYSESVVDQASADAEALAALNVMMSDNITSGVLVCTPAAIEPPFLSDMCGGWWKADSYPEATLDGTVVGGAGFEWTDSLGLGNFMHQATVGARPVYRTNVFGTKPALQFDGADDFLSITAPLILENILGTMSDDFTIFIVFKQAAADDNGMLLCTPVTFHQIWSRGGLGTIKLYDGGTVFDSNVSAVPITDPQALCVRNKAFVSENMVTVNKTELGLFGSSNTGFRFSQFSGVEGAGFPTPVRYFGGYLAEIFCYCRLLTDAERNQVYDEYLKVKYTVLP